MRKLTYFISCSLTVLHSQPPNSTNATNTSFVLSCHFIVLALIPGLILLPFELLQSFHDFSPVIFLKSHLSLSLDIFNIQTPLLGTQAVLVGLLSFASGKILAHTKELVNSCN